MLYSWRGFLGCIKGTDPSTDGVTVVPKVASDGCCQVTRLPVVSHCNITTMDVPRPEAPLLVTFKDLLNIDFFFVADGFLACTTMLIQLPFQSGISAWEWKGN
jgi:hypothetical protein